ncbi:MAG TPA: hypothetical protein VGM87_16785 [Roseomonas sp.]
MPHILRGRFWAEDGLFLLDAWTRPFLDAMTTPHTGYFNIVASLAAQAATLMPLQYAPVASCAVALAFQTLPALLLVLSAIPWLQRPSHLLIALLVVATLPSSEEVWINSITSQYHLILCGGIILADRVHTGRVRFLHGLILGLAPLSGPGSAFLIPLFLARACIDRSRGRLIQAAILGLCAIPQIASIFINLEANRNFGIDPELLLLIIYAKHIVSPLLGRAHSVDIASDLAQHHQLGDVGILPLLIPAAALLAFAFTVLRYGNTESRWLAAAGAVVLFLSYFGALGPQAQLLGADFGMRYAFAPQLLLELSLLGIAVTASAPVRKVTRIIVLWTVFVGLHGFVLVDQKMARGPSWREQIAARDPAANAPIVLWPTSWAIRLPPGL